MTKKNFTLIGFCSDEGVLRNNGRPGAVQGPAAIRAALSGFSNYKILPQLPDITVKDHDLEFAQEKLAKVIQDLLKKNITPICLGGGHEMAYGHGLGVYKHFKEKKIGIINFDAHFDLRPLKECKGTSGTPFLQLANCCEQNHKKFSYMVLAIQKASNMPLLFDTAKKLNVTVVMREEIENVHAIEIKKKLDAFIKNQDGIYLTICLDVFHKDLAPGVSAQAVNGISLDVFQTLFTHILETGKVVSFDVAEMSPPYDIDGKTAKLTAQIIDLFVEKCR